MVIRKNKHNKSRRNNSRKYFSYKSRTQKGGVANACVLDVAMGGRRQSMCGTSSNLHNINPQAGMDLNSRVMKYGTRVPLGFNIVQGGSKCGDSGVGTSNPKSATFKQYLKNLDKQLDINHQSGGGVSTDPSEFIAGMPVYKAYDDCCPPAIVGGKLQFGTPGQPVCGFGAVKGGSRNKQSTRGSKKHGSKKHSNKKNNVQHGGDFIGIGRSKPSTFSDAFNGPMGVFEYPDDMTKRTFDEKQPNYSVRAI
jgi:hypothetical protein